MQTGLLCIQNSIALLEIMRAGIATFDRQIAEIYRNHPDRAITESFPGAGAGAGAAFDCGGGNRARSLRHRLIAWPALRASLQ